MPSSRLAGRLRRPGDRFSLRSVFCPRILTGACLLLCLQSCSSRGAVVQWTPETALEESAAPEYGDDLEAQSLLRAVDMSLRSLAAAPESELRFGSERISAVALRETLLDFKAQVRKHGLSKELYRHLRRNYRVFRSAAKNVLFTGYFEARLNGSRQPDEKYRYPLYRIPEDLVTLSLDDFKEGRAGAELIGRLTPERRVVPYFSRAEIDYQDALAGRGLELVWIDSAVDVFFLQIQGSGIVSLREGGQMRVNYAGKNGRPYRPIGALLIRRGILDRENVSMQSIRTYLREHPAEQREIFEFNPSYVFFREVAEGPLGSSGVPLTALRSIATDRRLFPPGALAFVETVQPAAAGGSVKWQPVRSFVLNQDTGGAIQGAGRVDLFTGHGDAAELYAGQLQHSGDLYFLLKRGAGQSAGIADKPPK